MGGRLGRVGLTWVRSDWCRLNPGEVGSGEARLVGSVKV